MVVLTDNSQNKIEISIEKIREKAKAVLSALDSPEGELSILIVDDSQIGSLNKKYLNREGTTNVIAFPMQEGQFSDVNPQLLGDIVISVETACKEGELSGISMEERLTQLLVHGILHLFGYDHEKTEQEARRMEAKARNFSN
ncbi:MAG: rRNA maturation RNase YbeY [Deltaproteobacteria bacterium]|nr:rRNA maturation RNase YbeY [Deltaproteobacteria bacterium]